MWFSSLPSGLGTIGGPESDEHSPLHVAMNKFIAIIFLTVSILPFGTPAFADFQKGAEAYVRGDYATALREWKPLAEQGDPYTQFILGQMYYKGEGVTQDYKAAFKWYTLAAEQGNVFAQQNLGRMYKQGPGVTQDYKAAVEWYKLAAEQGGVNAMTSLGVAYATGLGVVQDYVRAYMWFDISAAHGAEPAAGRGNRDVIAKILTDDEIARAQVLVHECMAKNYKGC